MCAKPPSRRPSSETSTSRSQKQGLVRKRFTALVGTLFTLFKALIALLRRLRGGEVVIGSLISYMYKTYAPFGRTVSEMTQSG